MEKYGTIPKRFTKAWWEYFWEYYKWYVVGGGIALILIITTIVQVLNKTEYDLQVMYAGGAAFSQETSDKLSQVLSEAVDDITGDKEKNTLFQTLPLSEEAQQDAQYAYAMTTKLSIETQVGDTDLYLMNREVLNSFLNNESVEGCFQTVDSWAAAPVPEEKLVKSKEDQPLAVNLEGNQLMEAQGIDTTDLYLVVRALYDRFSDDSEKSQLHQNSVKAANYILEAGN